MNFYTFSFCYDVPESVRHRLVIGRRKFFPVIVPSRIERRRVTFMSDAAVTDLNGKSGQTFHTILRGLFPGYSMVQLENPAAYVEQGHFGTSWIETGRTNFVRNSGIAEGK